MVKVEKNTRNATADIGPGDLCEAELLSALAHKIGHEIGNPLTSIISLASIISRFADTGQDKLAQYASSITQEAWRVSGITEKLVLLLSQQPGIHGICDVTTAVGQAVERLKTRTTLEVSSIVISNKTTQSPTAFVDSEQLLVLIKELLTNALEESNELSDKGEKVELVIDANDGFAIVEVRNSSRAPNPHPLNELFNPLVSTRSAGRNLGIGLTTASVIAKRFAGKLDLEECHDDNSTSFVVRVEFPIKKTDTESDTSEKSEVVREIREKGIAGKSSSSVLVVEDQAEVSSAVRKILEFTLSGDRTVLCLGGREAVERIRSGEQFAAILCDYNLDSINGRQIYENLDPSSRDRFAYMTGDVNAVVDGALHGCPCLSKPFEPNELVSLVELLLEG